MFGTFKMGPPDIQTLVSLIKEFTPKCGGVLLQVSRHAFTSTK